MIRFPFKFILGAALLGLASVSQAVTLNNAFGAQPFLDTPLPGTTVATRPELAGTVLADDLQSFSYSGLNISGTVQNRVVRETGTGTLDFYWRVNVDPTSTGGGVSAFRLADFGYANITDADWRIDGLGSVAPTTGRLFNPASYPTGDINFLFSGNGVPAGAGSYFFFLHTNATGYDKNATYDLLAGPNQTLSGTFNTFRPVPVPAAFWLFGSALAGLGLLAKKRKLA